MNWEQLKAIIWLRWRLSRNQFYRGSQLNAVLSILMIFATIVGLAGAFIGSLISGIFAGMHAPAQTLLLIWDGALFVFLIFWSIGVLVEIQRSESIDLYKLLHLPISLNQVFIFNYVASHTSRYALFSGLAFLGYTLGLTFGGGLRYVLVILLVFGFVFTVSAWTYCLRGWLAALMTNKRRRRSIVVWVTLFIVFMGQIPNLVINGGRFLNRNSPQIQTQTSETGQQKTSNSHYNRRNTKTDFVNTPNFLRAHLLIPPAWVSYGTMTLSQGNPWPALGWTVIFWCVGGLGLAKSYRMTLKYYSGYGGSETAAKVAPAVGTTNEASVHAVEPSKNALIQRKLPFVSEDISGLTMATILSLFRSPELKMAAILPIMAAGVLLFLVPSADLAKMPEAFLLFPATGAITVTCFTFMQIGGNIFGLDRNGFRALVLLPTPRHHILIARNLALIPFQLVVAIVLLVAIFVKFPISVDMVLTALVQLPAAIIVMGLFSNLYSILVPYRMALGSLKAQKPQAVVVFASLIGMLFLPFVMIPLIIPPALHWLFHAQGWVTWLPIGFLAGSAILVGVYGLYVCLIPLEGRLLQRRELHILKQVTEEVE